MAKGQGVELEQRLKASVISLLGGVHTYSDYEPYF